MVKQFFEKKSILVTLGCKTYCVVYKQFDVYNVLRESMSEQEAKTLIKFIESQVECSFEQA